MIDLVQFIESLGPAFWFIANLLVLYISVMLVVFVVLYPIWFDPRATTAGKFVFRFLGSLIGAIGLIFIGVFIDPRAGVAWYQFPGDVFWWRPAVRLLVYLYIAYTVTALVAILALRKFKPHLLRTAPNVDENTIPVKVRPSRR